MLESEAVSDPIRGFEFIDLNKCLARSFNQYLLYITENELKLTRKDKNKLGIHFIIKELVKVCKKTNNKKWFYYENPLEVKYLNSSINTYPETLKNLYYVLFHLKYLF